MKIKDWLTRAIKINYWCVGDGWKPLVRKLCEDIAEIDENVEVMQVKEKFGGLRFYVGEANDQVFDLITKAEAESLVTCAECGSREDVSTKPLKGEFWILSLCKKCRGGKKG